MIHIHPLLTADILPVRAAALGTPGEREEDHNALHLGAYARGQLAGASSYVYSPLEDGTPAFRLYALCVLESFQDQGLAELMLLTAQDKLLQAGTEWLWTEAAGTDYSFYARMGFTSMAMPIERERETSSHMKWHLKAHICG